MQVATWLYPSLVTVLIFAAWRRYGIRAQRGGSGIPDVAGAIVELFGYAIAAILALVAWLVWALVG